MRALTMDTVRRAAPLPACLRQARDWLRRHPEWWVLALCAAAWLCLLQRSDGVGFTAICRGGFNWRDLGWIPAPDGGLPLMTAAMMLPLAAGPARYAAFHSLWRRRRRAIAVFLCGYLGLWLAAAWLLDAASALWLSAVNNLSLSLAGATLAAAAWQQGPDKAAALAACHRGRALAPSGWAADRDCLLYGLQNGAACLRSCWLLMLLPGAGGHGLAVMLGVTALATTERYRRPAAAVSTAALLGLALWLAIAA
ncbi:Uncharacterized protein ChrSV_1902 [Chromobacterium vaccinii]|nr:Uncharacterized protein ChrSW_1902 [Chromobacterium vaccinii]QND89360.1 Uncharacterized protein ChrSV_1902 [Chromobacterium vaccinii]